MDVSLLETRVDAGGAKIVSVKGVMVQTMKSKSTNDDIQIHKSTNDEIHKPQTMISKSTAVLTG